MGEVEHVDDQVPEFPQAGVPHELGLGYGGHRVPINIRATGRPEPVSIYVQHSPSVGEAVPVHSDILQVSGGQSPGMVEGAGSSQRAVQIDLLGPPEPPSGVRLLLKGLLVVARQHLPLVLRLLALQLGQGAGGGDESGGRRAQLIVEGPRVAETSRGDEQARIILQQHVVHVLTRAQKFQYLQRHLLAVLHERRQAHQTGEQLLVVLLLLLYPKVVHDRESVERAVGRERVHARALYPAPLPLPILPPLLGLRLRPDRRPLEVPHQAAAHGQVEEQACQYQRGPPPTVLGEQVLGHGGEYERPYTAPAHGQPGGERSLLVEVIGDYDHGRDEAQGQTETGEDAEREYQNFHRVRV